MLTNKQKKLNDFVIREAGLELDEDNHVIDQDTGIPIIIKGKSVKYNNGAISRLMPDEIEFDPLSNPLLANQICSNYIFKLCEEESLNATSYGISNSEKNHPGKAICIGDRRIESDQYISDSLKYIDLIAKLNNTDTNSKDTIKLKSYDMKKPPKSKKR